MRKIIILILTIAVGVGIVAPSGERTVYGIRDVARKDKYTFLVCGIDDAAENTDAIIIFNYDVTDNVGSFLQIPRDTYLRVSDRVDKINSIYPSERSAGGSSESAMQTLTDTVTSTLGIRIDGYLCFTVDAIRRLVDSIGGVDIELPYDFSFADADGNNRMELNAGTHHLNGADAVKFIRYRSGYALGDLGRVDAQKFFLSAFVRKLKNSLNLRLLCKSAFKPTDGIITNLKLMDILGIAVKMRGRISTADVKYANLPGAARQTESGRWYYFINKPAALKTIKLMKLSVDGEFDAGGAMLNPSTGEYKTLYYNENTGCRIYDDTDLKRVDIKD